MVTVSQPQAHHLAGEQKARANSSSRHGGLSYSGFQREGNEGSFSLEMSFRLWNYRGTEGVGYEVQPTAVVRALQLLGCMGKRKSP